MAECKQGGEHEPVKVGGHYYCHKCNKPLPPEKGKQK